MASLVLDWPVVLGEKMIDQMGRLNQCCGQMTMKVDDGRSKPTKIISSLDVD